MIKNIACITAIFFVCITCRSNSQILVGNKIYIEDSGLMFPSCEGKIAMFNFLRDSINAFSDKEEYYLPIAIDKNISDDVFYTVINNDIIALSIYGGNSIVTINGNVVRVSIDELINNDYMTDMVKTFSGTFHTLDGTLNIDRSPIKEALLHASDLNDVGFDFANMNDTLLLVTRVEDKIKIWQNVSNDSASIYFEPQLEFRTDILLKFNSFSVNNNLYLVDERLSFYKIDKNELIKLDVIIHENVKSAPKDYSLVINKSLNTVYLILKSNLKKDDINGFNSLVKEYLIEVDLNQN